MHTPTRRRVALRCLAQPDDELGAHMAVMFEPLYGTFPPNTLFRFKEIKQARQLDCT